MPVLNAELPIRESESVFSETDPPSYWPSVYIIEGLGQCCNLLSLLWTWERSCASNALCAENVSAPLMNTEAVDSDYTLEQLLEIFGDGTVDALCRIGMLASIDIEIVDQVRVGELLQYSVKQTRVLGGMSRFAVQASVEAQVVAHGTMVGAQLEGIL